MKFKMQCSGVLEIQIRPSIVRVHMYTMTDLFEKIPKMSISHPLASSPLSYDRQQAEQMETNTETHEVSQHLFELLIMIHVIPLQ